MKNIFNKNSTFILVISAFLASCNSDFAPIVTIDLPAAAKVLVPNMYLQNNVKASMYVGQNQPVLANKPFLLIPNANIELYENGVLQNGWVNNNTFYILPNFKPTAGNIYTTKVTVAGFPVAEATDTMPNIVNFTINKTGNIKYFEDRQGGFGGPGGGGNQSFFDTLVEVKFSFVDDGNTSDYYRILILENDSTGYQLGQKYVDGGFGTRKNEIHCSDIVYQNSNDPLGNIGGSDADKISLAANYFTDVTFNGKQKDIKFYIPVGIDTLQINGGTGYSKANFYLQHITKSAYLHATSVANYDNESGIFSQPSLVYSNYINGLGILGCVSTKQIELQIK